MTDTTSSATFLRAVGVLGLAAAIFNCTVGGGIFRLPSGAAAAAGSAAPFVYLICAAVAGRALVLSAACGNGNDDEAKPAACGEWPANTPCADPDASFCDYADQQYCSNDDHPGGLPRAPDFLRLGLSRRCGCDGRFFCNACEAHRAGVDTWLSSAPPKTIPLPPDCRL